MKMVCFCEKVHFRFIYTPPSRSNACFGECSHQLMVAKKMGFLLPDDNNRLKK
jgi:hypothetical protein